MDDAAPNVLNLKLQAGPLTDPVSKEARTSRDAEKLPADVNLNEYGAPSWNGSTLFLDVAQGDRAQTISNPLLGWPDIARLFGDSGGVHLTHSSFDTAPYRKMAFDSPFTRQAGADPVSIASAEAVAVLTDQMEFRMLN